MLEEPYRIKIKVTLLPESKRKKYLVNSLLNKNKK